MGLILSLIASVLFLLLTPINIIVVIWKNIKSKGFFRTIDGYFMQTARDIDIFGNSNFRTLFNTTLRKNNGYQFGKRDETISSVLGKNQRDNTLSLIGWGIVYLLWFIDVPYWFKGGHCINSIVEYK